MDELDRRIASLRKPGDRPVIELVDEEMVPIFAAMSGAQRMALAFSMADSARSMLDACLRSQHPDWDDEDIEREAVRRFSRGAT